MRKSFALFDFDNTMMRGDSILLFMRYAWHKKLCSFFDLFRFVTAGGLFTLRLASPKQAKEMALRFMKGQSKHDFALAADAFCKEILLPRLYPQAVSTVQQHLAAGHEVLIISASPAFYLEPLKALLGVHDVLGTRLETDAHKRFTGRIVGINCRGDEKPLRLQAYLETTNAQLDFDTSSAYGDSTHDIPMLKLCKSAYAVNPGRKMQSQMHTVPGITTLTWKGRH